MPLTLAGVTLTDANNRAVLSAADAAQANALSLEAAPGSTAGNGILKTAGTGLPNGNGTALLGSATAPAAGANVVTTPALAAGNYDIKVKAFYGATADVANNAKLVVGGALVTNLPVLAVANGAAVEVELRRVAVAANGTIAVQAIAAGAAGSLYNAVLSWTPVQ